ncbi:hypothetical protein K1719_045335 [Acacia pycnantha]|nr:hypothetical protein K1719_045335 [Acacia pycnantha]
MFSGTSERWNLANSLVSRKARIVLAAQYRTTADDQLTCSLAYVADSHEYLTRPGESVGSLLVKLKALKLSSLVVFWHVDWNNLSKRIDLVLFSLDIECAPLDGLNYTTWQIL